MKKHRLRLRLIVRIPAYEVKIIIKALKVKITIEKRSETGPVPHRGRPSPGDQPQPLQVSAAA